MEIQAFVQEMEALAPPELAEPYDEGRIGLVVEGTRRADRIVAALDATVRVAGEAVALGADVLVVHHPPFFAPMTRVEGTPARLLRVLLAAGVHVYAMHTNFDRAPGGINDSLADLLGLSERVPLELGLVGSTSTDADALAAQLGPLRVYGELGRIERLAIVGGSGFDADLIEEAARLGADAFLSSEIRHHVARDAPIPCIESTHYALESPGMRALADRMGWAYLDDPPYLQHCG
ncbi:MAG: Nif3-like dinuclear metal center hexameric protein [Methanospirillum sp.]